VIRDLSGDLVKRLSPISLESLNESKEMESFPAQETFSRKRVLLSDLLFCERYSYMSANVGR
jgi:hypothetical protein